MIEVIFITYLGRTYENKLKQAYEKLHN